MPSKNAQEIYLSKLDAEIELLLQRSNALVAKIAEMTSVGITVHSQVELLGAMRVAMKSLATDRAEGLRVLETGENRTHPRGSE
jgi:hypothetical protein